MGNIGATVDITLLKPLERSSQKPEPCIAPFVTKNVGSGLETETDRILDRGTDDLTPIPPPLTFVLGDFLAGFSPCPPLTFCHSAPICFIISGADKPEFLCF